MLDRADALRAVFMATSTAPLVRDPKTAAELVARPRVNRQACGGTSVTLVVV